MNQHGRQPHQYRSGPRQQFDKPRGGTGPQAQRPTASAQRVSNFKTLMRIAGGEEALAILLDVDMGRMHDLLQGLNFGDEMAFHVEYELALSSGWLDRNNPPEPGPLVKRAPEPEPVVPPRALHTPAPKSPVDAAKGTSGAGAAPSPDAEPVAPASVAAEPASASVGATPIEVSPGAVPSEQPKPPAKPVVSVKKAHKVVPVASAESEPPSPGDDPKRVPRTFSVASPVATPSTSAAEPSIEAIARATNHTQKEEIFMTATTVDRADQLRNLRRANLTALTSRPKTKSGLAKALGKTPANVSHLLSGQKQFEREAAQEIERVLGLPENWFESAHKATDVPESAWQILQGERDPAVNASDAPRRRGRPRKIADTGLQAPPSTAAPGAPRRGRPPGSKNAAAAASPVGRAAPAPVAPPAASGSTPSLFVASSSGQEVAAPKRRGRPPKSASAPASSAADNAQSLLSASTDEKVSIPGGSVVTAATRRIINEAEGNIGAIAEALVKTIVEKSREGRMTEKTALKLLTDVMAM